MPAPPLKEILSIDDEVLRLLGKSFEEIASMGLREFSDLSYDLGIIWQVRGEGGRVKGLTIAVKSQKQAVEI